jgi:hypothetical protein
VPVNVCSSLTGGVACAGTTSAIATAIAPASDHRHLRNMLDLPWVAAPSAQPTVAPCTLAVKVTLGGNLHRATA